MQEGKGIIKFFLVAITLVSLLQYFYMLPTRSVEKAADNYAKSITAGLADLDADDQKEAEDAARTSYLDSMSNEVVFEIPMIKKWTYQELKGSQLALGLDLKGGMSVVLQVDLRDFIRSLANDSKDPTFIAALENASKALAGSQSDYVTLFADEFRKASNGEKKLAPIFYVNESLREDINFETSDGEVISTIRQKANETVGLTFDLLKERIDELGVIQPNISLDASRDLITVELPGISNPERARAFLVNAANLEFWNVYRISDSGIVAAFLKADEKLSQLNELGSAEETEAEEPEFTTSERTEYEYDENGNITDSTVVVDTTFNAQNNLTNSGPLLSKLTLNASAGGQATMPLAVMGLAQENQRDEIDAYLARPEIASLFPKDIVFRWARSPATGYTSLEEDEKAATTYELYAIKKDKGNTAPLEGDRVIRASANPNPQNGQIEVSLMMDGEGARTWGQMTTKAANDNNREIAILLDDKVVSAPRVINPIMTGSSSISGTFTLQEGKDLAKILQLGKLPAKPQIIQETLVGPSLGAENISKSITSMLIGFGIVILFMIFYYGGGGIVSIIALLLNLFFIFGALASIGTVLTLPGFAGILLTVGMAVDANVIIYERIREELREGKTVLMAIKDGFGHSYSAIIDANVTTILVAIVLAYFGMGPIKGFAVVLIIGVIFSLFTAVLVGRLMIDYWTINRGNDISFWTGPSQNAFSNFNFDWLGKRRMAYAFSGIVIALGLVSFVVRGFDLGVDFKGGYSYNVQFAEGSNVDAETLRTSLASYLGDKAPTVKAVSTENTFNIVTDYLINSTEETAADDVQKQIFEGINSVVGGTLDLNKFKNPDSSGTRVTSSTKVGPTIADDIKWSSFYAATFALLMIFLYIFIRFSKWQYSMGAVAALFHDVLFVLSIFSIFHGILPFSLEVDQIFIGAVLTVIGYSINDTVVVFDRIREYLNRYSKLDKNDVINKAVNSTFSRTVITSLTTLFVVFILFLFGGTSTKGFAFALLIGVLIGTYSSVFIATPVMSDLSGELKSTEKKKKSFSRAAQAK